VFFEKLPSYLVGIEACAWAHYWARELCTLGHTVRLMPAKDVKAYVKGNKNDATEARDERLPADARASLAVLVAQIEACQEQIGTLDKRIHTQHRANEASCRLETIPGIGVIGATAIEATLSNSAVFASGRDFAAWIGLVPR